MEKLKTILSSPYAGGGIAVALALWEAILFVGPPAAYMDHVTRDQYLGWIFAGFALACAYAFITQQFKIHGFETPNAALVFDSRDVNHMQHGNVTRKVGTEQEYCDEYIYAIGVVNLSGKPIPGCRLRLEQSKPHNASEQRLNRAMKVRGDSQQQSTGDFVINPSHEKRPNVYIEVLQELVPQKPGMAVPADIRLRYANTLDATENMFTRSEYLLTFLLEGMAKPVPFTLAVEYDSKKRRWDVREVDKT